MILQPADVKLINFLTDSEFVLTPEIASRHFYKTLRQAQRRLKQLYENKYLKRSRPNINSTYFYWVTDKKIGQKYHRSMCTEFYLEFIKRYPVNKFEWGGRSFKQHGILPDLVFWSGSKIYAIEIGNTKLISSKDKKDKYKGLLDANECLELICVSQFCPKLGLRYKWIDSKKMMEDWK